MAKIETIGEAIKSYLERGSIDYEDLITFCMEQYNASDIAVEPLCTAVERVRILKEYEDYAKSIVDGIVRNFSHKKLKNHLKENMIPTLGNILRHVAERCVRNKLCRISQKNEVWSLLDAALGDPSNLFVEGKVPETDGETFIAAVRRGLEKMIRQAVVAKVYGDITDDLLLGV